MLTTGGRQFEDWSADYRLFSCARVDPAGLFQICRQEVAAKQPAQAPFIVSMDDTILRKTGVKIPGVSWRRDPLGPPFQTNLVRAQRYLQLSAALPPQHEAAPGRMVPIQFCHAPSVKKPGKKATEDQIRQYKEAKRTQNLSLQGNRQIHDLRQKLDDDDPKNPRPLWMLFDGSFTNRNGLNNMPKNTATIGRMRHDAKLFHPLNANNHRSGAGRKRWYGERSPTPEQVRKDDSIPWQTVDVFAAGKMHAMKIKTIPRVYWRVTGHERPLRIIIIAPLAYRLKNGARLLYRDPAYLVVTDPNIDVKDAVKAYLSRWDIESNFRDEKQLIGIGQAQVRSQSAIDTAPAFAVASYSLLLLAGANTYGVNGLPDALPPPKWRKKKKPRASTANLISQLRYDLWSEALGFTHFSGFASGHSPSTKPEKFKPHLPSAVLYAMQ
ncbi:MAG: hypothetical protein FD159_2759 [Syntrophaceae bacterium]|nr:MAG: hypothetical protein FD159_2759 [Syntrophaceae bacterium]